MDLCNFHKRQVHLESTPNKEWKIYETHNRYENYQYEAKIFRSISNMKPKYLIDVQVNFPEFEQQYCGFLTWIRKFMHTVHIFLQKKWKNVLENNKSLLFLLKVLYTQYNISSIRDKNTDCTGKLTCTGKWNFDRLKNCLSPIFTVYPDF